VAVTFDVLPWPSAKQPDVAGVNTLLANHWSGDFCLMRRPQVQPLSEQCSMKPILRVLLSALGLEVDASVGIGTATPRAALDVAGAINAQGDVVAGGTVFGNGSGLSSLNAENLTGTVPDAALSANVALRQGGNNFAGTQTVTGNQTVSGRLGVGTANPATTLHIRQATDNGGFDTDNNGIRLEAASGQYWGIQTQAGGDLVFNNGANLAYVYMSRTGGLIHITSDARFKKNVHPLDRTLERVQQLRPVTFQYRQAPDDSPPIVGFL